jgi:hypothetical protein
MIKNANGLCSSPSSTGISLDQIAQVWGVSREQALLRLHGDAHLMSFEHAPAQVHAQAEARAATHVFWCRGLSENN